MSFVAILVGSSSDLTIMREAVDVLNKLGIPFEMRIRSAHRTPVETADFITDCEKRGCKVFIAAAGLAAHLAGFVAAHTLCPVIGVPMAAGSLGGMDALLSTVQMPAGIPVATVAIGSTGAKNAAYLAAQILALHDDALKTRLLDIRQAQREQILAQNESLPHASSS
jgi:5-(carboxyamino)imidazole ribonucleotide mutase